MSDKLRILHLEDEEDYSDLVRATLVHEGLEAEVHWVASRDSFEAACRPDGHDLILADYSLPDYTGVQALEYARKVCPETPFILLSGTIGEPAAIESLRCGATDYVLKQWPDRLVPAVRRAIQEAQERRRRLRAEAELRQRESALARLGWRLNTSTTPLEAARIIGAFADELFGWDAFSFELFDLEGRLPRQILLVDTMEGQRKELPPDEREQCASPTARRVMASGGELILRDANPSPPTDTHMFGDSSRPSRSLMFVPLRNGNKTIGVVAVQSYQVNAYTPSQMELLQLLADHCGGALERINAEQASREMESRFRELFDHSPDAIFVESEAGVVLDANRAACRLHGYSREQLLGKHVSELVPPERRREVAEHFAAMVRGDCARVEGESWSADGCVIPVEIRTGRIRFAGAPALLLHVRDVTEQRRLEAQLRQSQKMEAIGQLAGGVAHDFNNILTVIHGHASMLATGGSLPEGALRSAQQIVLAAERATGLTRQLLAFSRRQIMQTRPLDFNVVLANLSKMLSRILGEDITLRVDYCPQSPVVLADETMMEQVTLNLAVNARDAMPEGGELTIGISLVDFSEGKAAQKAEARAGRFVCMSVRDTGGGIRPEHLPHIFEPFFTTKAKGKGTGLGLATVYGVVKQHQGWVEVESQVAGGSVFRVYLPLVTGPATVTAHSEFESNVRGGSETILLVEDEEPVREMVCNLLRTHGYQVVVAESGVRALELWENCRNEVDLLLTDLVMPGGVNGRELADRLRDQNPELRVIYMSGYSADILGKQFVMRPGVNFLQKPYPPGRLTSAVRESLDSCPN